MPISFACGQCGKDYLVSDTLAGKRAVCKACNFRMTIPGGPAPAASATPPRPAASRPASTPKGDVPVARVVARPASATRAADVPVARVVSRASEPAHDIYGLNESPAPLPRLTPRSATAEDATIAEAPVKKKKKKGFFSSGKKKKSQASGFRYSGTGIGPIRLIAIIVAVGAGAVGGWGLLGKSDVQAFHKQLLALDDELLAAIQPIRSPAEAQMASPRIRGIYERIITHLDKNGRQKARKDVIEEVNREFLPQLQAKDGQIGRELARIALIPGAMPALNIQDLQRRLIQVGQSLSDSP